MLILQWKLIRNTAPSLCLSSINFTQRMQWAYSCSLILNIEGATTTKSFLAKYHSWAKYKIFASDIIIFLLVLDGFQPHHPPVIPTTHMVILINCSLFIHYVKFLPSSFFYTVVIRVIPGTFHFLTQPVIFSCVSNYNRNCWGQPAGQKCLTVASLSCGVTGIIFTQKV